MKCIFCDIIDGKIPSKKIYEDDVVLAFLDISNDYPGHSLVIPKKHYESLDDIDINALNHVMKISKKLKLELASKLNYDGFTLEQNNGFVQEVKHFHMHLIPKYQSGKKLELDEVYNIIKSN